MTTTKKKYKKITPKQIVTVYWYRKDNKPNVLIANRLKVSLSKVHYIVGMLLREGLIDPYPRRWGRSSNNGSDARKFINRYK